tara:strand:- start:15 stop:476 length:462 start_codon:yes stop_codon:yes gene_type:complete
MLTITPNIKKLLMLYIIIQIILISELKPKVFLAILVWIFHILFWVFVMFSFLNKRASMINMYYVIPFTYLIHILPFHTLETAKTYLMENNMDAKQYMEDKISDLFIIPTLFINLKNQLEKFCFFSPLSPQGMMLFGMISGVLYWRVPSLMKKQ